MTDPILQNLIEGDLLGFVFACYTARIGSLVFAMMIFYLSGIVYIRMKSLFVVSLLWFFVGSIFIAMFRAFAFIPVAFVLLSLAGILIDLLYLKGR